MSALERLGIEDKDEKRYYVTCPKCAHTRKKDSTKSLMVCKDDDGIRFSCFHDDCEWHGDRQWIGNGVDRDEITYEAPEFVYPIPSGTPKPEIAGNVTFYDYRDSDGNLLYYKVRLQKPDGSKVFWPLALTKSGEWVRKQPPIKTWYGLQDINKSDQVILVEGEKARDKAAKIFTQAAVLAWPGGAGANRILSDVFGCKEITIWPDNDDEGIKQAKQIARQLPGQVYMVDPTSLPPKADLGDDLTIEQISSVWNTRSIVNCLSIEGQYSGAEITEKFLRMKAGDRLTWNNMQDLYLPRSGMIIIEGRSGHGKTTTMVNIFAQYIERNVPVVFYSYEMPAERILLKLVMLLDGKERNAVPYLNEEAFIKEIVAGTNETYNRIVPKLGESIFISDAYVPFDALLRDLSAPSMLGMKVFIDYIQYIPGGSEGEDNRYLMIKSFAEQLQNVSHKNDLIIYAGAQLTPGTNPRQDSPREGKDIHNAAELVLRVWNRRAGEAMGENRKDLSNLPGDLFLEVRKNRNGFVGKTYCFELDNCAIIKSLGQEGSF